MASFSGMEVFQFKITLKCIRPQIWRRIQVPADYTFQQLHWAIQDSMGWDSNCGNYQYHLHTYRMTVNGKKISIGIPEHDSEYFNFKETIHEENVEVCDYFVAPKTKALYIYDFFWEHEVVLEKILPSSEGTTYPKCIAGKRACPPENIGGCEGYKRLLVIIRTPDHPNYKWYTEWLERNGNWPNGDPEKFDPSDVHFHEGNLHLRFGS